MTPQRLPAHIKDRAGLWDLDHAACWRCCRSGPNARKLLLLLLVSGVAVNKPAIIVLRHEANFLAFGLARYAHAALRRHCPHLWLGVFAQGEAGMSELL